MIKFEKIKKFFSKKKRKNPNLVLKEKKKSSPKKRKNFKINLEFLKKMNFFKDKYIPYFLITCGIFVVTIIALVIGPFFRVENIEIIRKDNLINMNIAYKSIESLRGEKLFNIKEIDVFQKFKNYQNNIQGINLKLSLPSTLKIEVESYKEVFNVTINDNTYILVENGTLIPSLYSKTLPELNIKKNIDKNMFIEYKQVFTPSYIERINNILKQLKENFVDINIANLYYYEAERELHVELEDKGLLLFSVDSDNEVDEQVEKLAIFNKDYFGLTSGIYVYLDLRIRNKVFYCHRDRQNQCELNLKGVYN